MQSMYIYTYIYTYIYSTNVMRYSANIIDQTRERETMSPNTNKCIGIPVKFNE